MQRPARGWRSRWRICYNTSDEIAEPTKLRNVVMKGMLRQINDESAVRHTPSLKRKDRRTTEVALSEQGLYPFEPGASSSAFALSR